MNRRFALYTGDLMGIPHDENYLIYRWMEHDCVVLFSVAKLGKAINVHLAANKPGVKRVRQAMREFAHFSFDTFKCKMIITIVKIKHVMQWCRDIGFKKLGSKKDYHIFILLKEDL